MNNHSLTNEHLAIEVVPQADQVTLRLRDHATGMVWGPVPLLNLEIYEKFVERTECFTRYTVRSVEPLGDAIHVVVGDPLREITVGLFLQLTGRELAVLQQPAEVCERNPALFRLFAIDILPGLLHCPGEGRILLPINHGVTFSPAGKPRLHDAFMLYGEQDRWELLPTFPLCGVLRSEGGLVALARQSPEETQCRVATDGQGNGSTGFAMVYRQHWPDPVEFAIRELRVQPIAPQADLTHAVAERLRTYVMEDLGKTTLTARIRECPDLAYLIHAYIMKPYFGEQRQGGQYFAPEATRDGSFNLQMTFAEAGEALRQFKAAGVDKVLTQCCGWIPRGHDGLYPTRFPIDLRLGGEAGFRQLIRDGHALGYQMNVHENFIDHYRESPDWDPEVVLQDIHGEPWISGWWAGGISHRGWPLAYSEAQLAGTMRSIRDLGIRGLFYVDGMGNPLYRNYHPRHRGSRSAFARGLNRILQTAKDIFGTTGVENGFIYCSIIPDIVVMHGGEAIVASMPAHWPVTALALESVPVWQLAMHGLTLVESHGHTWSDAMRTVLWGLHPRTQWGTRPGALYGTVSTETIAAIKGMYDLCLGTYGHLQLLPITRYRKLGDGQHETTYGDGTVVQADFNTRELRVNGISVPRPAALA